MCAHADNTIETIEELAQKLYPAIQEQFIFISSCNDCINSNPDHPNAALYNLINELKNEFQSLVTYENKLVFPSVIKVFDKKEKNDGSPMPSIADLLKLTKSKELKILELVAEVQIEIFLLDLADKDTAINKLIHFFQNDFVIGRNKWNSMIQARLNTCSCFITQMNLKLNIHE